MATISGLPGTAGRTSTAGQARVTAREPALLEWVAGAVATARPPLSFPPHRAPVTVDAGSLRSLRPGKRPLLAVTLRAGGSSYDVVVKAYRDDRGAATLQLLHALAAAGLVEPSPDAVTRGLGWSAEHRALIAERAPGVPWRDLLHAPPRVLAAAGAAAGRWLATLQRSGAGLPGRAGYRGYADMARQVDALAARCAAHADHLRGLADAAGSLLAAPAPLVPSHGDLHPHNVHVVLTGIEPRVTALDLDTAGLRRPAYDAGYALAQLLVMSWLRRGSFVPGARAGRAFWARWSPGEPAAGDLAAVPAEMARALVQSLHYELVVLCNGRTDLVPRWCALAAAALRDGVDDLLDRLAAGGVP